MCWHATRSCVMPVIHFVDRSYISYISSKLNAGHDVEFIDGVVQRNIITTSDKGQVMHG